jgi:hypothetical protein
MTFITSNCVEEYQSNGTSKTRIKPLYALSEMFHESLPKGKLKENLNALEQYVKDVSKSKGITLPNANAFSNARGQWFESMIAVQGWNYRIKHDLTDILIVKMPNVSTFDFRRIFDIETRAMLEDLERSLLANTKEVRLITSNPDLLIIQQENLIKKEYNTEINSLSSEKINEALNLYKSLENKSLWRSIVAGIGVKTSFRPDRRLQLVHEGNILKALFAHLKMRHWDREGKFKYYGASSEKLTRADFNALQTAATHSIIDVNSIPERAVDDIFSLLTVEEIDLMYSEIFKYQVPYL